VDRSKIEWGKVMEVDGGKKTFPVKPRDSPNCIPRGQYCSSVQGSVGRHPRVTA
jgi:hypothetical protein